MQPHFYHETGGCNEETFVHYICKTWLFEKGCKFIVNNIEYEVDEVSTEKTLHTSFGDYRPDIIVTTVSGKIFYFEIKTTNKKTEHYVPKWDELGNDVVEIDTRYFINQKYKNDIPTFNLIYSDGECFIKSYTRNDYDSTIALRKIQWKRQDKLNYKIQWERLDWFWNELQKYLQGTAVEDDVLQEFNKLDYSDKIWCFYNLKNKSCVSLKECFRDSLNNCFYEMLACLEDKYDRTTIKCKQKSPLIYEVICSRILTYLDYKMHQNESIKIKVSAGKILSLNYMKDIEEKVSNLNNKVDEDIRRLEDLEYCRQLPYVKSISPLSHWDSEYYSLSQLYFKIVFEDHVHNNYIKEIIGVSSLLKLSEISEELIQSNYLECKSIASNDLDNDFFKSAIKNDSLLWNSIERLKHKCDLITISKLQIRISESYSWIVLLDGCHTILEYSLGSNIEFGVFEKKMENTFTETIDAYVFSKKMIQSYAAIINSCKNNLWRVNFFYDRAVLNLYENGKVLRSCAIYIENSKDVKEKFHQTMKHLLWEAEKYNGIRFLTEGKFE